MPVSASDLRHVVVVGGGVLGASVAAHVARLGAPVTLVTRARLADGASGRSLSWLNSAAARSADYHRLRLLGLDRYRDLDVPWVRFDGGLAWVAPSELAEQRATVEHLRSVGYPAEWVSPREVSARVPGVDPAAVPAHGALLTPAEGWVDLPSLVDHLVGDVVAHGGRVLTGAGDARVEVHGGRVTGVTTGGGSVPADAVVLATGAAVPAAVAALGLGLVIPDATSTALLVRTAPVRTGLQAVLNTPRVAVRPAPGGGLVVDAAWSEREVVAVDGSFEVRMSTVDGLLREASAVLAGRPTLTAASWGAGLKPIPGDGEPVLGPVPGVDGLHVAFTHSGATLALVVGELLAGEVVRDEPSPLLASFRPARFE